MGPAGGCQSKLSWQLRVNGLSSVASTVVELRDSSERPWSVQSGDRHVAGGGEVPGSGRNVGPPFPWDTEWGAQRHNCHVISVTQAFFTGRRQTQCGVPGQP